MLILLDQLRNMFDQLLPIVDHQRTIKHTPFLIINDNRKVKKEVGNKYIIYFTPRKCLNNSDI